MALMRLCGLSAAAPTSKATSARYCIDCANSYGENPEYLKCHTGQVDLVTGDEIVKYCSIERADCYGSDRCGSRGSRFVPRPAA